MHTKTSKKIITLALALILALGILANTTLAAYTASEWAKPELEKGQSYGLIPDVLKDADLTKPITRAEFAAVAVKAYENFTGTTASPVASNPFTDTSNTDVLKAYNINIVNGTSATTYSPNGILTRQDAATMLTRVEKKAYISGWTLATDSNYTLNFTQPAKFADDGNISGYAKASVYFMNAKGVINGTGSNMFSPAVTATRQEALIIAARMVDNLKGKTVDYTKSDPPTPTPTPTPTPPTPPSGGIDSAWVGHWVKTSFAQRGIYYSNVDFDYYFYANGTFLFFDYRVGSGLLEKYEGKYSTSNGKVYFTDIKLYRYSSSSSDEHEKNREKYGLDLPKYEFSIGPDIRQDMTTEYEFGSDIDGDTLKITTIRQWLETSNEYSISSADTFRRVP